MTDLDWKMLIELYDKHNITKAAAALFITQSALTKRIQSLEQELGAQIVIRNSKGISFTPKGKYLVEKARIINDLVGETKAHIAENTSSGNLLKIGMPNSFARLHFPKMMSAFLKEHSNINFEITPNSSDVIIKNLTEGRIDIGIICGDFPYIGEKHLLFKEDLYMFIPVSKAVEDVANMPFILSYFNPMVKLLIEQFRYQFFGTNFQETYSVPYAEIAIEMVEHELGSCFLFGNQWQYNASKIDAIPITNDRCTPISRNVWMMFSEHAQQQEGLNAFIQFIQSYYDH